MFASSNVPMDRSGGLYGSHEYGLYGSHAAKSRRYSKNRSEGHSELAASGLYSEEQLLRIETLRDSDKPMYVHISTSLYMFHPSLTPIQFPA